MVPRSNVELLEDLVTEILLKLPVKSIVRFKCVAKTWYHLFTNPTFVSQHLRKNRGNSHSLVVHHRHCLNNNIGMLSFADNQTTVTYHDLHQQLPPPFADKKFVSLAVGDGLVCLHDLKDSSMTLWNPTTKEFRILPDCNQFIPLHTDESIPTYLACGMDPLSNDYKVLYIRKYGNPEFKNQYAIYRMSSDSWRALKEEDVKIVEKLALLPNKSNACVNGVCYWQVILKPMVLTFHLSTEVFKLLGSPLPGRCGKLIPLHDGRMAFWDSLFLSRRTDQCAVWVLNDEENWTKLFNIDPLPDVTNTYCLWTHGKVFIEYNRRQCSSLYDLETKEFSELGFETKYAWIYNYEESLITVHRE